MAARLDAVDHVFVLRFWREPSVDRTGPTHWRARIREINTRREFHAIGVDAACKIVRACLLSETEKADGGG